MLELIIEAREKGKIPNPENADAVQNAYEAETRVHGADFWVCTEGGIWCTILHSGLPEGTRIALYMVLGWLHGVKKMRIADAEGINSRAWLDGTFPHPLDW